MSSFEPVIYNGKKVPRFDVRNGVFYERQYDPTKGYSPRVKRTDVTTPKEASLAAAQTTLQDPDDKPTGTPMTVKQFWPHFIATSPRVGEAARARYELDYKLRIEPAIGKLKVRDVKIAHITKMYATMRSATYTVAGVERSYSEWSVYNLQTALQSFFGAAKDEGQRPDDLMSKLTDRQRVQMPDVSEVGEDKVYSPEEITKLLKHFGFDELDELLDWRMVVTVALLPETGCRISEHCGLKWTCVDFGKGGIYIQWQLEKNHSSNLVPLKWKKEIGQGARWVYPRKATMQLLWRYRAHLVSKGLYRKDGFVFPTRTHQATQPRWMLKKLGEALPIVGITRDVDLHCFRHTCVSHLADQDWSSRKIGRWIGDKPETVDRIYSHFLNEERFAEEGREALEAAFG